MTDRIENYHRPLRRSVMLKIINNKLINVLQLTLTVLVTTIDAQWEGMGDVGSARYELALLPHARP